MRKILYTTIFAVLILLFAISFNTNVYAATIVRKGQIKDTEVLWTLDEEETLTIGGKGKVPSYTIYIGGFTKSPWDSFKESIKKVVIKEGITGIGSDAFYRCSNIEKIITPSTLKYFTSLEDCTKIKSAGPIGSGADYEYAYRDNIPEYAFYNMKNLESFDVPEGVKSISWGAFEGCTKLKSVSLPKSLETIDYKVFAGCKELESIEIPENLKNIGYGNFIDCVKLKSVKFNTPNFIFEDGILYNIEKTILIENILDSAPSEYFIPETVETIGQYAFYRKKSIKTIHIPASVRKIEDEAFSKRSSAGISYCYFYGDVPEVKMYTFDNLSPSSITIYYPLENKTWTEENRKKIGKYQIVYKVNPNTIRRT